MNHQIKTVLGVLVAFNVIVAIYVLGSYKHATCAVSVSPTGKCWTEVVENYNFDQRHLLPVLALPEHN